MIRTTIRALQVDPNFNDRGHQQRLQTVVAVPLRSNPRFTTCTVEQERQSVMRGS